MSNNRSAKNNRSKNVISTLNNDLVDINSYFNSTIEKNNKSKNVNNTLNNSSFDFNNILSFTIKNHPLVDIFFDKLENKGVILSSSDKIKIGEFFNYILNTEATELLLFNFKIFLFDFLESDYCIENMNKTLSLPSINKKIIIDTYNTIHNEVFIERLLYLLQSDKKIHEIFINRYINPILQDGPDEFNLDYLVVNIITNIVSFVDFVSSRTKILKSTRLNSNVQRSENIKRTIPYVFNDFEQISRNFTDFKRFSKQSASNSIILTAHLLSNSYFKKPSNVLANSNSFVSPSVIYYFKIFPNDTKFISRTAQLSAETKIYNEVYKLSKYAYTPNILCKALTEEVNNFNTFFYSGKLAVKDMELLEKDIEAINKLSGIPVTTDTIWQNTEVIITNPGGPTLSNVFKTLSTEERRQVFFQIFYTLYVFDKFQISHGDLHLGNIFIIDIEPTEMTFVIPDESDLKKHFNFRFTTNKLVKIYDFDWGNISKTTKLDIPSLETIQIEKVDNPIRRPHGFGNRSGASNIYNNKLDKIIFLTWGLTHIRFNPKTRYSDLQILDERTLENKEFNDFIRNVYPGAYNKSQISEEPIEETYDFSFIEKYEDKTEYDQEEVLREWTEFSNIMNITGTIENYSIDDCNIEDSIKKLEWKDYFYKITHIPNKLYGKIIKDSTNFPENNQLWIPDEIVLSNYQTLQLPYFDSLKYTGPIDLTVDRIYSILNKI